MVGGNEDYKTEHHYIIFFIRSSCSEISVSKQLPLKIEISMMQNLSSR
jgi:hypothetical protein